MERWSLEEKAERMQELVYPQHDRYGQTSGCSLTSFGDRYSYTPTPADNDGLWTNMYMISQVYKYAVTGSLDAKTNAKHAMNAMLFLQQVTGQYGYPARSFGKVGDPGTQYQSGKGQHTWFNSTAYPGWVYKSDTSADEICGHQVGISLYHDLLVSDKTEKETEKETNKERIRREKEGDVDQEEAKEAVLNITSWIVENGYTLVSNFNEVTTWGHWEPSTLNDNPDWYSERQLYSLQLLSWLKLGQRLSQNKTYSLLFDELWDKNDYGMNILDQKITTPDDNNPSDDELAWLSYMAWLRAEKVSQNGEENANVYFPPRFWQSINRTISINKVSKPSLWNIIYLSTVATINSSSPTTNHQHHHQHHHQDDIPSSSSSSSPSFHDPLYSSPPLPQLWKDGLWCLKSWPTELIDWPIYNSHRFDLVWSHHVDRHGTANSKTLLRYDEVPFYQWNANVFRVDGGGGMKEYDPSAFLFPYWMAVYNFPEAPY